MSQTNIPNAIALFGDHVFSETWIIVTDSNDHHIQITEDELIPEEVPVFKNRHVKVYYFGQEYWIPKELHFPM